MYQDFMKNFLLITMESEKVHGEKWITDYVEKMNEYTQEICGFKLIIEDEEYENMMSKP